MHGEIQPGGMGFMGHGNHRRDANAAAHQQRLAGRMVQREVIDRLGNKDLASLGENPVQQGRAAPALILAQNADLIFAAVCRIAGHRILTQEFRRHDNVQMGAGGPFRQRRAIQRGKLVQCHIVGHLVDIDDFHPHHRCITGDLVFMDFGIVAFFQPGLVFLGGDHCLIGFNPLFAVHRERKWPGMRRQICRIYSQGLVFIFQIQILLQVAFIERMLGRLVTAIRIELEIPPPFLGQVQATVFNHVIQLRQYWRGGGNIHRRPAERTLGKQAFQVPGAGLHAATTHCATLGADPVGCAFLTVRLPDLVAIEHQFRAGGDGPRRAFTGAFVAALTEFLQAEIDRLVMRQRQIGCDHTRLQARPQIRIKNDLANAADFP